MKIIVGLGNPGDKYINTRHNLGFMVVDKLVDGSQSPLVWEDNQKLKSLIIKINDLIFAKPQTYMNNSGLAVKSLINYYKLAAADLIVIHDDADLEFGKIKVRMGGSAAGHHGVDSIITSLGSDQFIRVRVGIGPDQNLDSVNMEQFVLEPFISKEQHHLKKVIQTAVQAVEILLSQGLEKAQNQFN